MLCGKRSAAASRRIGLGFTLIELLVAVSILAILAVISWRGLSTLAATRERLVPETDDVRALLTGFGQMERDLAEAPVNQTLYALSSPAVRVVVADGRQTLEILRIAPPAPDGGSAVQTVFYSVQDGSLVRQWTPPARVYTATAVEQLQTATLVPQVSSMTVRVWLQNTGWVAPAAAPAVMPPGIEVQLQRTDGTTFRRVMLVG
ncbi:MAG TPA: type II secretion system protein GspJ [Burkholderiaceae bacterium]